VGTRASLDDRLNMAGVPPNLAPIEAWRRLRSVEGPVTTIIDLYELAARRRGLTADDLQAPERFSLARAVMPDIWPGWDLTASSERVGDVIEAFTTEEVARTL